MSEKPSPLEMIRANADLVLDEARTELRRDIGFDSAGVLWLDGFIQRRYEEGVTEETSGLVNTLGSFLGTCIAQSYGGNWQETEHGWAVIVDRDLAVFPFNKVHKHLTKGAEDSVLSLFKGVPALIAQTQTEDPSAATESKSEAEPGPLPRSLIRRIGNLFRRL